VEDAYGNGALCDGAVHAERSKEDAKLTDCRSVPAGQNFRRGSKREPTPSETAVEHAENCAAGRHVVCLGKQVIRVR
jgi:hypothetical protein